MQAAQCVSSLQASGKHYTPFFSCFRHSDAVRCSIYNLSIANTYGKPVDQSQAIALSVQAGQFGCYGCKLTGYQDTLLANVGAQFYGKSYIEGYV